MGARFDDENLDVLQNIEFAIVEVYRADPSLIDIDAKDAIDALVRHYRAEEDQRRPPAPNNLSERARRVFESVGAMCEWRLGRRVIDAQDAMPVTVSLPLADLIGCLRKIQKSIPRWSERGGRQGYLKFVIEYVR